MNELIKAAIVYECLSFNLFLQSGEIKCLIIDNQDLKLGHFRDGQVKSSIVSLQGIVIK